MEYWLGEISHIPSHFRIDQIKLLEWIAHIHTVASQGANEPVSFAQVRDKLLQVGAGEDKIQRRGVQLSDPLQEDAENMRIYSVSRNAEGVGCKERMHLFEKEVSEIFERFYTPDTPLPHHLIHVTCTGYVAPSPAQKIISRRQAKNVLVTHAYHMGCYAAVPAIRIALGSLSLSSSNKSVDIVHTEMCSLHLQPMRHSTEQLVIQSLFADGFIKYSLFKQQPQGASFKILSLYEEVIPESLETMTWRCEDTCHAMTLSKKVPLLIKKALPGYFSLLAEQVHIDEAQLKSRAYFAIHPGGTKILRDIKELFSLSSEQIAHSLDVFQNFGNMSSATLPHIWEKMLKDDNVPKDAWVVSLAYGPGLTIMGGVFQKCLF